MSTEFLTRQIAFAKAAAHSDFLGATEQVELLQEITSARNVVDFFDIETRWEIAFRDGVLVNLEGGAA